jgi:hypothetical protein
MPTDAYQERRTIGNNQGKPYLIRYQSQHLESQDSQLIRSIDGINQPPYFTKNIIRDDDILIYQPVLDEPHYANHQGQRVQIYDKERSSLHADIIAITNIR